MSYFILSLLVSLFLLRSLRKRARHCPACLRLGRIRFYGRYHCQACGRDFLLDEAGRPAPTLWQAAVGPLLTWFIVLLAVLALGLWIERSFCHAWLVGVAFLPYLLAYCCAARTKQFPTDERAG